jgi:hypothetical protein
MRVRLLSQGSSSLVQSKANTSGIINLNPLAGRNLNIPGSSRVTTFRASAPAAQAVNPFTAKFTTSPFYSFSREPSLSFSIEPEYRLQKDSTNQDVLAPAQTYTLNLQKTMEATFK